MHDARPARREGCTGQLRIDHGSSQLPFEWPIHPGNHAGVTRTVRSSAGNASLRIGGMEIRGAPVCDGESWRTLPENARPGDRRC
jgi:hypothetical protein